jgi:hypothetical protein
MSKFITGKELEQAISSIIWDAKEKLLIVSPYIKLDNYFQKLFDNHKFRHDLPIIIVFGKNENEVHRSLSKDDFEFFKKFPNISIVYVRNLHAKYYGNEKKGVITSINLYDHSFKNNIEFGVYTEQTILSTLAGQFTSNPDNDAWNYCWDIAHDNDVIFIKRPVYENKTFIINLGKNYLKSEVLLDYTDSFYGARINDYTPRRLNEYGDYISANENNVEMPSRKDVEKENFRKSVNDINTGYCIRTGERIPFNPKQPLSKFAWNTWSQFGNIDFPEKFCHKTGKPSYGKTSMRNPIL